jgi:hypothetical protein
MQVDNIPRIFKPVLVQVALMFWERIRVIHLTKVWVVPTRMLLPIEVVSYPEEGIQIVYPVASQISQQLLYITECCTFSISLSFCGLR